ncbi:hypothetical protein AURDEDRAFT_164986 [Auricularia subglabra TFB-10046 SS5]|nr:hypothetical protein AURDEDRAFT_164986 [Auricularia subglabra TFB-10046 SS5]
MLAPFVAVLHEPLVQLLREPFATVPHVSSLPVLNRAFGPLQDQPFVPVLDSPLMLLLLRLFAPVLDDHLAPVPGRRAWADAEQPVPPLHVPLVSVVPLVDLLAHVLDASFPLSVRASFARRRDASLTNQVDDPLVSLLAVIGTSFARAIREPCVPAVRLLDGSFPSLVAECSAPLPGADLLPVLDDAPE